MSDPLVLAAAGSQTVAVAVAVVGTLVVVGLGAATLRLLRTGRDLRRTGEGLAAEATELLEELRVAVADLESRAAAAERQVERVDALVGSAESISVAVGEASRLASTALAKPVIKAVALGAGASRAGRRLGAGGPPAPRRRRV